MIRRATFNDLPAMLELGRRAHAASRYARIPIDETQSKLNVASMLNNRAQCVFVAEVGGEVVGMLLGITTPWFFTSKEPYATDLFWYAERRGQGVALFRRFLKWAFEERRVSSVESAVSFGGNPKHIARTEQLYRRLGFRRVGGATFALQRGEP